MEKSLTDDELSTLALAADPITTLDTDAVPISDVIEGSGVRLLPEWYMPAPMGGAQPLRGWRRRIALLVVGTFITITAFGVCNTYGEFTF